MSDTSDQNPQDLEKASLDDVYESLGTSASGLTSADAKTRIEKYGRNELVDKEVSDLEKFLRFFWGPIAWMIEAAALLSLLMGHWADLSIILVLLFYNAMCGFGWFVTALPWTIIGLVWVYMLVWMLVLDLVKLGLYRRIAHGGHRHPDWYTRFLEGRSAGHSLAAAGRVSQ